MARGRGLHNDLGSLHSPFSLFCAVANLPAKEPLRIVPALINPCPVHLLNQIWVVRSRCQFFFSHLRPKCFVEVTLCVFALMALCGQGYRQLFLIFTSSGSPFFHFIPVVYSPGNRLFSFSGTWLVRPVYPIVLLRDIVFVLVLPLLLLLQAYQTGGVFGQQPIHFKHAHLYAIPKCVRLNQRTDSGDEDGIQEIMTAIGKIKCFGNTKENRVTYVERLERFFLANDIDDDH